MQAQGGGSKVEKENQPQTPKPKLVKAPTPQQPELTE